MRSINDDIATIQEAYANEAEFDGKHVVVPQDFLTRLNAKLNPPGPTIFDHIKEACAKLAREDEESARACGWVEIKDANVSYVWQPEHCWIAPNWRAACDPTFDGSERQAKWLAELDAIISAA